MWVIVAVSLGLSGQPKLSIVSGAKYQSEAECVRATHIRANFDSDHGDIAFSVCMPKDSVQIGAAPAPAPSPPAARTPPSDSAE